MNTKVNNEPLLIVDDLSVAFRMQQSVNTVVHNVSFELHAGETLALVGESGSGKSVTALSILQLLNPTQATYPSGSIRYKGEEIIGASAATLKRIRGDRIGMIFQEPMTSLNPLHTVEKQINEVLLIHKGMDKYFFQTILFSDIAKGF
jgi:microcin C transport system ATP-binding protein